MGHKCIVSVSIFLFIVQHRIGIILQSDELIFIKFLLLDIVESYDVFLLKIFMDHFKGIFPLQIYDKSWASGEVIENIADFKFIEC